MAPHAADIFSLHELGGTGHSLEFLPFGVDRLEVDFAQRRNIEMGASVLFDRDFPPAALGVVGTVTHHGRLVVGAFVQVLAFADLLHNSKFFDPAALDGRQQPIVDVHQNNNRRRIAELPLRTLGVRGDQQFGDPPFGPLGALRVGGDLAACLQPREDLIGG